MGLPPWAASESQVFALVTGTNGGLGFSICQRMIDEFLASPTRPSAEHLVLVASTRSTSKTRDTIARLRRHLAQAAAKHDPSAPTAAAARVHLLGVEMDLLDLRSVYDAAARLTVSGISSSAADDTSGVQNLCLPRLDVLVLNAGIGGWRGLDWPMAVWTVLTDTIQATTWPVYKLASVGLLTAPQKVRGSGTGGETAKMAEQKTAQEPLGQVFCANTFGHYVLAHELMPLLSNAEGRTASQGRGRIIWISSIEAVEDSYDADDIQGLKSLTPYESTKRLTDIMVLSAEQPGVAALTRPWLAVDDQQCLKDGVALHETKPPRSYLAHPGICATEIVPLPLILQWCMFLSFMLARLLGSVWHPAVSYGGACAPVWLALADQATLDAQEAYPATGDEHEDHDHDGDGDGDAAAPPPPARKSKWGSSADIYGRARVRRTHVDGWGLGGALGAQALEDEAVSKGSRKRLARGAGVPGALTPERRADFVQRGWEIWRELETLRTRWRDALFG